MSRARWGTLFAGVAGSGFIAAAALAGTLLWPATAVELWQPVSDPANYLGLINEHVFPFRLLNLLLVVSFFALVLLVHHLSAARPDGDDLQVDEPVMSWTVWLGLLGAVLAAGLHVWLGLRLPALARLAASGSQTAVADWGAQIQFWGRWGPAGAYLLLCSWLLWRTRYWQRWRGVFSRVAAVSLLVVAIGFTMSRYAVYPSGMGTKLFAVAWLELGVWCLLLVAHRFWAQELAVYDAEA